MKFDARKLKTLNSSAGNVLRVNPPYYLLNKNHNDKRSDVIFFGCDFKNVPRDVNMAEFIRLNNKCLDFIRRECAGCNLYYRPHPVETDEFKSLNLGSFKMVKDNTIGELFLYKNASRIRHVFSFASSISMAAYSLGLNSYIFWRLFKPIFGQVANSGFEDFFGGMPDSFYISDLEKPLKDNRITLQRDQLLESHLSNLLKKYKGRVWFIAVDPGFLMIMASMTKLVKHLSPNREAGLIIVNHNRWDSIDIDEVGEYFDDIVFLPKVAYSLKGRNLSNLIKTVFWVKKFNIGREDILFGVGPCSFVENCFISYFNNPRIAITTEQNLELTHTFESPLDLSDFNIKLPAFLFNKLIEPALGLYQTTRLQRPSGRNGFYFTRYQKSVDKVFDAVYALKFHNN